MNPIEYLGILGNILIVIGFFSNKDWFIRFFNILGSICFVIYGTILQTWSAMMCSLILIVLNVVKLGMKRKENRRIRLE